MAARDAEALSGGSLELKTRDSRPQKVPKRDLASSGRKGTPFCISVLDPGLRFEEDREFLLTRDA